MLCSISVSTNTTAGTTKSGSNWLDRLRSIKNFPASENLDLDNFLLTNSNSESSTQSNTNDNRVTSDPTAQLSLNTSTTTWAVSNVLSDLFNMGGSHGGGDSGDFQRKKSVRKQTNPNKLFGIVSKVDEFVQVETVARANSFHSDKTSNVGDDVEEEDEEEKGKCSVGDDCKELKGYSKSEVTVIDTSFDVWKFDKLIFRRKNVWEVRDKKGKSWNFSNFKKRKANSLSDNGNGNGNGCLTKKAKLAANSDFDSSKESNGGDFALLSNDNPKVQDDKREEIHNNMLNGNFQVPRRRIHFPRSPQKSKKNGSSVILIKALPTSKKCWKNLSKNRTKDSESQQS